MKLESGLGASISKTIFYNQYDCILLLVSNASMIFLLSIIINLELSFKTFLQVFSKFIFDILYIPKQLYFVKNYFLIFIISVDYPHRSAYFVTPPLLLRPKEVLRLKGVPDEVHCKCRYGIARLRRAAGKRTTKKLTNLKIFSIY